MPEGAERESREAALDGTAIDLNSGAGAGGHRLLAEPRRRGLRELERVRLDEDRRVAAVLEPSDEAEVVQELRDLLGPRLDHADVPAGRLPERLGLSQR